MEDSFLDKVHEISKQFFALPTEEKLKYARTAYQIEGYGSDKVLTDEQRLDWEVLEEYIKNMNLSESLLKAMATFIERGGELFSGPVWRSPNDDRKVQLLSSVSKA
ncbi:hypothetical protein P3S67_021197 [Capsicum chacoense]